MLYVGRAEKRKGLPYLLRAFRMLHARIPATRLIVVGPDSRRLRRYRATIGQEAGPSIVFVDGVSNVDLPRYHRSAHIFCSPATGNESQGYVLLEAMSAALPVVASNIEGYASVLSHGVEGLLVPPKDSSALADVLTALARDPGARQRLGRAGQLRAEEYSWPRVTQQFISYYDRLRTERALTTGRVAAAGTVTADMDARAEGRWMQWRA